jgi:hypothetical protein
MRGWVSYNPECRDCGGKMHGSPADYDEMGGFCVDEPFGRKAYNLWQKDVGRLPDDIRYYMKDIENIHLFRVMYGYGWGCTVVFAETRKDAVYRFLERYQKELHPQDKESLNYTYAGTLDQYGGVFYYYEHE